MSATIRYAVPEDAQLLPAIETSAAQAFRMIEDLSWLADSPPMSIERHRQLIALSTCWVALDVENRPQGFLSAERHGDDLHIFELSVMRSMQGQGLGRSLVEAAKDYARSKRLRCSKTCLGMHHFTRGWDSRLIPAQIWIKG